MSARGGGLRPLRAALDTWTPGRGVAADPLHAVAAAWPGIVGAGVAANSVPLEISGTALIVGTRSSAWSQQLQFLSPQILRGLRDLACGVALERITFRTGLARRGPSRARLPAAAPARRKAASGAEAPAPAANLDAAFERLRRRLAARRPAGLVCDDCGAPLDEPAAGRRGPNAPSRRCAPCAGEAESARRVAVLRIVYLAPWLTADDLREHVPGLSAGEYERARAYLLQRWWFALERARSAGKLSPSGLERHIGSSYVLLQSRLPPDRITPAVVRNLLGPELERLLWPHAPEH